MSPRFKVGPAVHLVLIEEDKVLLAKRANTGYEDGKWSVPAGHLDGGESVREATVREAAEEIDIAIEVDDVRFGHVMHRQHNATPRKAGGDHTELVSEREAVARAERPATVASLVEDLRALGLAADATVMVHSSLSRLGYVCGGAHAVVAALLEAVGPGGTVVMPAHSAHLSDPAAWSNPPVPEAWWVTVRDETPAYDPRLTPTRQMGAIVECFRHVPGVRRSAHPTVSVAAVGPRSERVVDAHELANQHGETSPLARLYELDALVLLLGVSHANNTSLHLAEHRASVPNKVWTTRSSPVLVDGRRAWISYPDLEDDDRDFERLGQDFAETGREAHGPVGAGSGRLMGVRDVVDYAREWMAANRR